MTSTRRWPGICVTTAVALFTLLAVFAVGNYSADAHPFVHPQKKLFSGRWYKSSADLTASPPWFGTAFPNASYPCDGGYDAPSCVSKWQGPAYASYADWNNQPDTARFNVQGYRDHNWDNNIYIVDTVPGAPQGLLGYATYHNQNNQSCVPDPYPGYTYCSVYRYSDAVIIDNNHTGPYGTAQSRQATITHELGHVLSLRHESVNADESLLYPCGYDNTGPIPPSVMSYDCISPPGYGPYYDVQVTGVGGVPASGVSAVVVNATITQPSRGSFLTVYPSDAGLPTASNLNFVPGQTVPNLATVKVGADGRVNVYNAGGQTHVIFDVVGWYGDTPDGAPNEPTPTPTPEPGGYGFYHPLPPARIVDTRSGLGWPGKLGHNGTAAVTVRGRGGVPPSGVTAVALNATVTESTAASYLTVYPSDAAQPTSSNLNFGPGQTVPNLVIVGVGADGKVNVYNALGQVHVIFDVVGWYGGLGTDGTLFRSLSPSRIMDTRTGLGWPGKVGHNGTATVNVVNIGGVPASAKAVVVNTTVTEPTAASYLTVWPSGATRPTASNLNFGAGQTVPNLVMVKVGPDGKVNVYNAVGQVHVIFDVVGYFE
ncbi:MAG: hypothetical protein E6I03_13255 [Chloroflexi bacterium]|nr:MAG: hypothetical protein E6I03_13255 [Chloroflexota bacterium]